MNNVIELRTCSIFLDKNGFCVVDVKSLDCDIVTQKDANEVCDAVFEVCSQKRTPLVFDMIDFKGQMEPGVRAIFRHNEKLAKIKHTTAVIINSLGNRILVNFYIKFNKPETTLKMFSSKGSAVDWLSKTFERETELV